ncbi:MAG: glucose-1-phosphate cytidylyltransferase [Pseudomonadota bacterium]
MKTVILCGGQGTRIRGVVENIPKPMIPVGAFPILWHIMKYYACWRHKEFVLCLGYQADVIKDFFRNYKAHMCDYTVFLGDSKRVEYHGKHDEADWQVTLAETGLNAMTGVRIKRIKKYIAEDEHFMLTYGDGVGDVDLDKLLAFHLSHGKILTMTGVHPPGRFGELMSDAKGLVTEFNEKPQSTGGCINGGFFVCRREIFDYLSDDESLVFEQEPIKKLVADRQMMLYEHGGFWQPMDTYREYSLLNGLYDAGKAPWVIWK